MSQAKVTSYYSLRKNARNKNEDTIGDKTKKRKPQQKSEKPVKETSIPKKESKAKKPELPSQSKDIDFQTSAEKYEVNYNNATNYCFAERNSPLFEINITIRVSDASQGIEGKENSPTGTPKINNLIFTPGIRGKTQFFLSKKPLFLESEKENSKSSGNNATKQQGKFIPKELKEAVANFQERLEKVESYVSNPFKLTSIISPAPVSEQGETLRHCRRLNRDVNSTLPNVPAYRRYDYLADSNISSSLILPYHFKKLSQIFQSLDSVVSSLHNRKEKIYFEKVQEGVQKMIKRDFSKTELGQVLKIMPSAFDISLKRNNSKNANEPKYQLIISPNRCNESGNKESKSRKFVTVTPEDLVNRKKQFDGNLLQLVHDYHQIFLNHSHIPLVSIENIKRWHPKFPLNSIPEVEGATLPEIPENKGKGVKASKKAAEEPLSNKNTVTERTTLVQNSLTSKNALKEECADFIAKIQAVEKSANLLECMELNSDHLQRKNMLERLPQIMQIMWHYFIAERKSAVCVDTAVGKILHSFSSLSSQEDAKAHLSLVAEVFPGWLSFVQIPKGLYITMNKTKNLNEMLKSLNFE